MSRTSYLRTSATRAGKGVVALHPPRMLLWGLRGLVKNVSDSPAWPLETAPEQSDQRSTVSFNARHVEPIDPSTESPINLPNTKTKADMARKPTSTFDFEPQQFPVNLTSPSLASAPVERHEESSHAVQFSPITSTISPASKLTPANAPRPETPSSYALRLRAESELARHPGQEAADPKPPRLGLGESQRSASDETLPSLIPVAPGRAQPQNTTERGEALRAAMSVLQGAGWNSMPTKQPDLKSTNAVHIGSVDIHIHSSPAPALPREARQVVRPTAAIAPITRGFAASFGLSQG
ncbi:MAG TPA: hypothetical protein VK828_02975 [Terriglobales bacterium]|jgi:hypothetical protein|nr:hypothetical protein [Terriglobales bacterium]